MTTNGAMTEGATFETSGTVSGDFFNVTWSADGVQAAYEFKAADGGTSIWLSDAEGSNLRQLTLSDHKQAKDPQWSPDGSQVAYSHGDKTYIINSDGSGLRLVSPETEAAPPPSGQYFVLQSGNMYIQTTDAQLVREIVATWTGQ
jgi:Tol biopolymer transport system component